MNEKPGWKTTEFWLAMVVVVLGALPQAFDAESPWVKLGGILASALAAAGYGFSRGMVKTDQSVTNVKEATFLPSGERIDEEK